VLLNFLDYNGLLSPRQRHQPHENVRGFGSGNFYGIDGGRCGLDGYWLHDYSCLLFDFSLLLDYLPTRHTGKL
jgi:hypothetical protein